MDGIRLERVIDLPRGIVWEALVDPVLAGGWLHPDERLVEGVTGIVFDEPEVLQVVSPVFGEVRFELDVVPGGTRGESTRVALVLADEWIRLADRRRLWELRLDQLEHVLRGRPVDWRTWAEAHRAEHEAARLEEERGLAR